MMCRCWFLLVFCQCVVFVHITKGDTPANCTYEDVVGTWKFYIGQTGLDRTAKCYVPQRKPGLPPWTPEKTLIVNLLFPDKAVDQFHNEGFWTMIYNQGFEVQLDHRKYFAFSNYTLGNNGTATSYCDSTLSGWSHDFWGHNWACYYGQKTNSTLTAKTLKPKRRSVPHDFKYITNSNFAKNVNSAQKLWTATDYPWMEGWTLQERLSRAGGLSLSSRPKTLLPGLSFFGHPKTLLAARDLPASLDWRNVSGVNYVSPVRDQETCGSCYAFGSMAMLEARIRIITNGAMQPVFSTQDIMGCSNYSQGCDGGFPYLTAGKYAEDYGAVEETCFPYLGKDSACLTDQSCIRHYTTNYYYIGGFYGACSEEEMRVELVKNGPFAVSFEVYSDFEKYKSGIYQHTTLEDGFNPWEITNHVVLVVGYGETDGQKYWIVKNSWGTKWGEDGYFRIVRGTDECSIESMAVAATPLMP